MKKIPYKYLVRKINYLGVPSDDKVRANAYEYHEIGSYVLVYSEYHSGGLIGVVLEALSDEKAKNLNHEIVCEIDLDRHFDRMKRRREAEKIQKELEERIAEIKDEELFKIYAEKDQKTAELYSKLKELED